MYQPKSHHRLNNIQALRGIAVLAVVFSHLMSVERKYAGDRLLGDFFTIGISGVDLFFAISGFVMVYVAWNLPAGPRMAGSFLFARVGRIYPLYWLVSLIVLVIWLVYPSLVFVSNPEVSLIRSFALWPSKHQPLLAVGWTLIHEMYFYLIFAGLLLFSMRRRFWLLIGWGALVLAGLLAGLGADGPVLRLLTNPLSFEFLGGALAALILVRTSGRYWLLALLTGTAWYIGACLYSLHLGAAFWEYWTRAATFAPAVSLIVYGAVGAENAQKKLHGTLIWLGNQSYSLYLTHVLSLSATGRLWTYIASEGIWDNLVVLPLLLGLSIFVAQILHRLVELPMLAYVKRIRRDLF